MSVLAIKAPFFNDPLEVVDDREARISQRIREQLIGTSRWATAARAAVAAHAAHNHPVLIKGESGTGKRLVAQLIHEVSARCRGPFVTISCEDMAEEALDAALFGWIRELPSGRNRIQRGLVEAAQGGTLYISGVTTLSDLLKAKIARLIQEQEFRRLGDHMLEVADVRVILSATASPLNQEEERAWRILTVKDVLSIPPLRRRKADIEPLSRHFMTQFCQQTGRELRELTPGTLDTLRQYEWPRNVEELKQVIEELVKKSKPPRLDPAHLSAHLSQAVGFNDLSVPVTGLNLSEEVERFEKSLLCAALKQCQGKQVKAAELLGIRPTTLSAKLLRYDIDAKAFKRAARKH